MASSNLFSKKSSFEVSFGDSILLNENLNSLYCGNDNKRTTQNNVPFYRLHPADAVAAAAATTNASQEVPQSKGSALFGSVAEAKEDWVTNPLLPDPIPVKKAVTRQKVC